MLLHFILIHLYSYKRGCSPPSPQSYYSVFETKTDIYHFVFTHIPKSASYNLFLITRSSRPLSCWLLLLLLSLLLLLLLFIIIKHVLVGYPFSYNWFSRNPFGAKNYLTLLSFCLVSILYGALRRRPQSS